jgi:hypothetical protein
MILHRVRPLSSVHDNFGLQGSRLGPHIFAVLCICSWVSCNTTTVHDNFGLQGSRLGLTFLLFPIFVVEGFMQYNNNMHLYIACCIKKRLDTDLWFSWR